MCLEFHHGRCSRQDIVGDQVVADNGDDHSGRSDVFLDTAVDDAVIGDIDRFGEETGGDVCHQGFTLGIRQFFVFGTVNGVVFADINIVGIRADRKIAAVRDVGKCFILRGGNFVCLSVFLCLCVCFLCPLACYDVICDTVFHQVHRDHGKLQGCTALEKQNFVI